MKVSALLDLSLSHFGEIWPRPQACDCQTALYIPYSIFH